MKSKTAAHIFVFIALISNATMSYAQEFDQRRATALLQLERMTKDPNNPAKITTEYNRELLIRQRDLANEYKNLGCRTRTTAPRCHCITEHFSNLDKEGKENASRIRTCVMKSMSSLQSASARQDSNASVMRLTQRANDKCAEQIQRKYLNQRNACDSGSQTTIIPEIDGALPNLPCYPDAIISIWHAREDQLIKEMNLLQQQTKDNIVIIKKHYDAQEDFWKKNEQNTKRAVKAAAIASAMIGPGGVIVKSAEAIGLLTELVQQEFENEGLLNDTEKKVLTNLQHAKTYQSATQSIAHIIYEKSKNKPTSSRVSELKKNIVGTAIDEIIEITYQVVRESIRNSNNNEMLAIMEMAARHSQMISRDLRLIRDRIKEMKQKRCSM